jgi:hypothetical protein
MKQKDIIVIIVVVVVSCILSTVATKLIIHPDDKKQQAEVVQAINPDFSSPDKRFFNSKSIDPTLPIQIGNSANPDPFKGELVQ